MIIIAILLIGLREAKSVWAEAPVTLRQCFDLALQRSDTLASQSEVLKQAGERVWQARSGFAPVFSASASLLQQQDPGGGLASSFSPSSQTTVKATASLNVFRGLKDFSLSRQRGAEQDAAKFGLEQARVQLYLDTAQAFYSVLVDDLDLNHYRSEIEATEKRKRELQGMRSHARARDADIVAVDAAVASLDATLSSIRGHRAAAIESLTYLTGSLPAAEFSRELVPSVDLGTVEGWLDRVEARPDYVQAQLQVEAAEGGVWAVRSGHLPSADVSANYYFTRPGFLSAVTWDVQFGVSIPIFAGGLTHFQIREAMSQRNSREIARHQLRDQIVREIRMSHAQATANLDQIGKLNRAQHLSQQRYESLLKDNKQGLASNVDVLQALATAYQSKRAHDHARYSAQYDLLKLQVLSRRILP